MSPIRTLRVALGLGAALVAACSGSAATAPSPRALVVTATPAATTVRQGAEVAVRFTVTNTGLAPLVLYGGGCRTRVELRTATGGPVDGYADRACTLECAAERFAPGRPRTFEGRLSTRPWSNALQREVPLAPGTYQVVAVVDGTRDDCDANGRTRVLIESPPVTITVTR
jgi:hypothetical protein